MGKDKKKKLKELVDELIVGALNDEEIPFNYELCPYFIDCGIKVQKICIDDYENCPQYKQRKSNLNLN